MDLSYVLRAVRSEPWAMHPEAYCRLIGIVERHSRGDRMTDDEIRAAVGARRPSGASRNGRVSVMSLRGPIAHRMSMMVDVSGGTSTELFARDFRAAVADPDIDAIVLDVDSPGGSVNGVPELSQLIHDTRGTKRTIAVANDWAASAAYWVASAAREVVVTPSGEVGSVGVYASHTDISKADDMAGIKETLVHAGRYKIEGNPFEPLGDEARAELQRKVDHYHDLFVRDLARNRRTTLTAVRENYGEGRMVTAAEAVRRGMADRVATLEDVLGELGVDVGVVATARASAIKEVAAALNVPSHKLESLRRATFSDTPAPAVRERRQRMREREVNVLHCVE